MVKVRFTGKQSRYFTVDVCARTEEEARLKYAEMGTDDMNEIGEIEWNDIECEVIDEGDCEG